MIRKLLRLTFRAVRPSWAKVSAVAYISGVVATFNTIDLEKHDAYRQRSAWFTRVVLTVASACAMVGFRTAKTPLRQLGTGALTAIALPSLGSNLTEELDSPDTFFGRAA